MKNQEPVSNAHGEEHAEKANEYQEVINKKALGLVNYLNEEPKARLVPTLSVTERGIIPDVRLVLVDNKKEDEAETKDAGGDSDGSKTAPTTESTESQTA